MGRAPCCDKANVKKGPWSPEEDAQLKDYIEKHGTGGNWISLPQKAGLRRCGKSCRLRWLNYLRPNIKHGDFSDDEERIIYSLFASIGSRWSIIAAQLPGRTDNDIKNYWNTKLKKKLMAMAPSSQKRPPQSSAYASVSILDPSSSTALSPTRSGYRCSSESNYYALPARSFTGLETLSIPSSILNATCSSKLSAPSVTQTQECYLGPLNSYQLQVNFLRFGGEASCSSSDGSSTNQISYGNEAEHDYGVSNGAHLDLQSYLCNGVEGNQPNGSYGENPLDYSLEEIKQLMSTNLCNDFIVDENKTEGKVTYY